MMKRLLAGALMAAVVSPAFSAERPIGNSNPAKIAGEVVMVDPITGAPSNGIINASSTDASGTVTLGSTYQLIIAANSTRKGCTIQNTHASEALSVRVGVAGTIYSIPAGATFQCWSGSTVVLTDAIYVTAATTTHPFSASYQ